MKRLSFRDPDGFLVSHENRLFRVILESYREDFQRIQKEDLFNKFPIHIHRETDVPSTNEIRKWLEDQGFGRNSVLAILETEKFPFILYPWEWTPSMLAEAGIFTLELQKKLSLSGLTLKDASFFNVQFKNGQPVFLDLLSVKTAKYQYPWIPFGQALRHFIYPLMLLKYGLESDLKFLWRYQDGLSAGEIHKRLPFRSRFNVYELTHLHILSELKNASDDKSVKKSDNHQKLHNLLDWSISYLQHIKRRFESSDSYWKEYYDRDVKEDYAEEKQKAIRSMLGGLNLKGTALDLGANTGLYSELFLDFFDHVISLERDAASCAFMHEKINQATGNKDKIRTVIHADIINPDPALGWMNLERTPLLERLNSEFVSALGLVHHLYLASSIDFHEQALLFKMLSKKYALVEFIKPEDDKVKKLSVINPDRFAVYSKEAFLSAMCTYFKVVKSVPVSATRELFLLERK